MFFFFFFKASSCILLNCSQQAKGDLIQPKWMHVMTKGLGPKRTPGSAAFLNVHFKDAFRYYRKTRVKWQADVPWCRPCWGPSFFENLVRARGGLVRVTLLAASCLHGDICFQARVNVSLSFGTAHRAFKFTENSNVIFPQWSLMAKRSEKVQSNSIQS